MTEQPGSQPIPPGLSSNGHGPSARLAELIETLPQMLANALASVLAQVPVQTVSQRLRCTGCVMARAAWIAANETAVNAAQAALVQAQAEVAGLEDSDPRKGIPLQLAMFLPPGLRPGGPREMPGIADGAVMISGSVWCTGHMPGAPGKSSLLLANSAGYVTGAVSF
jgi:hypothetical protein